MNQGPTAWETAAQVAQVVTTILTGIGVIVSIILGVRSLRAIHEDRIERARPYLLFLRGASLIPAEIGEVRGIPGININIALKLLGANVGRLSFLPRGDWGRLHNYGNGAALEAKVTFLAHTVHMGSDQFQLDRKLLSKYPYDPHANEIPLTPSHMLPGTESHLFRIPTFYIADFDRRLDRVECVAVLRCKDITGRTYVTYQSTNFRVDTEGGLKLFATLGSELSEDDAAALFSDTSFLKDYLVQPSEF